MGTIGAALARELARLLPSPPACARGDRRAGWFRPLPAHRRPCAPGAARGRLHRERRERRPRGRSAVASAPFQLAGTRALHARSASLELADARARCPVTLGPE